MQISYDPQKRARTLAERGLDFEDAVRIFAGPTLDVVDDRRDYGEARIASFGRLENRLVVVIWTRRGAARHIISMRKCNERERKTYEAQLD